MACVDDVLSRKRALASERVVDRRGDVAVGDGTGGGLDPRDSPRQAVVAGLAQMRLVADPGRAALAGVVGIGIAGRAGKPRRRRDPVALGAPPHSAVAEVELLDPDAA